MVNTAKKILIIKTGSMPDEIISSHGDMEDFFVEGMGLAEDSFVVSEVFAGNNLPDLDKISGIVISGSRYMITDAYQWIAETAARINDAVKKNIPVLGVCFGHQLLVHALGGSVSYCLKGREIGTVRIQLNEKAKEDELFKVFPEREISVQVSHSQSVIELPADSELLAFNSHEAHHAFKLKNKRVWGVQFHPELNAMAIKLLIKFNREKIKEEGLDPEELSEKCIETQYGEKLLRRFARIIMENEKQAGE